MSLGIPDLRSTVASFASPTVRLRYGTASETSDRGYRFADPPTTSTIQAVVEPLAGTRTVRLPGGVELEADCRVWAQWGDLRERTDAHRGDLVVDAIGSRYEIVGSARWTHGPTPTGSWAEHLAVRVDREITAPPEEEEED